MKNKKQEFEDAKKTVEAYGAYSEEEIKKKAENIEELIKETIEKEIIPEDEVKIKNPEIIKTRMRGEKSREEIISSWEPKTKLGLEVKMGKLTNIDEILSSNKKILEPEIVDVLLKTNFDLILIGQAKGKFGGGKRRAWRQTQRKTQEGNVPTFSTMAVIGDENGHIGVGSGRAKETLPARDKAIRKAKLNIIKIKRTCAGFDCSCQEPHTVPFKTTGKAGSVSVTLIPASQGTGLVVANELKKILKLAGIKDVYSRTSGKKRTTFNLVKACLDALQKTTMRNTIK